MSFELSLDDPDEDLELRLHLVREDGMIMGSGKTTTKNARLSEIISNMILTDGKTGSLKFPRGDRGIADVETFNLIMEYLNAKKGQASRVPPSPLTSPILHVSEGFSEWDIEFINGVYTHGGCAGLITLMDAASYINIQHLLHIACAKIASLIMNKTEAEIKDMLDDRWVEGKRAGVDGKRQEGEKKRVEVDGKKQGVVRERHMVDDGTGSGKRIKLDEKDWLNR